MSILGERVEYDSPWVQVVTKDVELGPPRGRETFWSVRTVTDYAAVLAITEDGRIPLVRQFRPALDDHVLELPSGGIDPGESPEEAVRRELREETGCEADELVLLGSLYTDSGRMETLQWGYFAPNVRIVADGPSGDENLELLFVEPAELRRLVETNAFRMCTHLSVLAVAIVRGLIP